MVVILLAAVSVLAASGVGTLVVRGDKGGASPRAVEQPLGRFVVGGDKRSEGGTGGSVVTAGAGSKSLGGGSSQDSRGGAAESPSGGRGLPFMVSLAVPVLLAGAGFLLAGVGLRRLTEWTADP